jgi:nitrogen fixation protein
MRNSTVNQLIDRFKAFAVGHKYIRTFHVGELQDTDLTKNMTYPIMRVQYNGVNPVPKQNTYNFTLWFADLPRRKDEKNQNIQEIHSDMTLLALDFLKEVHNGLVLFGDNVQVGTTTVEAFTDEQHHFVSGVAMDVQLLVPDDWNACIIPADYAPGGAGYPSENMNVLALPIYDEGSFIVDAYDINFVGSGVTVTKTGNRAIVTITGGGGGGGLTCEDLPECATIISIESRLDSLETDKENVGVAQDIMDDHLAAANPHPQYALDSDLSGYVPYTGATTDVDLGTHNLTADHIALNVNPSGAGFVVGSTQWNNSLGSSQTLLKGGNVILKNGVDLVARIVNKVTPNTTLTKASYQAVRVSGATGGRLSVKLAQADSDTNSADTIGLVCETIAPNQEGFIITVGQLLDVNTTGSLQGETWVDGDVLYLSPTTAGKITKVKPTGTGHIVVIGYVEYAHANNGSIYVKVMNGWELDELHDVDITNVQNNDFLRYNSTFGTWKNHALTKTDVGLGNVDNTSDANKPISTATQTALDTIQVELDKNIEIALTGSNVTTTSATLVDITGLVTPTLPANSTWFFEVLMGTACTGTGGIKFGYTAPSGATGILYIEGTSSSAAAYQQATTSGALSSVGVNRFNGGSFTKMYGRVAVGATAGVVQLQFASGTSGQTSTIGGLGASIIKLTRVI